MNIIYKRLSLMAICLGGFALYHNAYAGLNPTQYFHHSEMQSSGKQVSLFDLQNTTYTNLPIQYASVVQAAELMATPPAKSVLKRARIMSLNERRIVGGSCWDYLNEVFTVADVNRETVFKGSFKNGPYVTGDHLHGGDWLYFVNHSYSDGEHSGMFIGWVDKVQNQALMLSYAGENRQQPARYSVYDVSHVYQIMRPTV